MKLSPDKTTVGYDNKIKMMKTRPRKLAPRSFHCEQKQWPLFYQEIKTRISLSRKQNYIARDPFTNQKVAPFKTWINELTKKVSLKRTNRLSFAIAR